MMNHTYLVTLYINRGTDLKEYKIQHDRAEWIIAGNYANDANLNTLINGIGTNQNISCRMNKKHAELIIVKKKKKTLSVNHKMK